MVRCILEISPGGSLHRDLLVTIFLSCFSRCILDLPYLFFSLDRMYKPIGSPTIYKQHVALDEGKTFSARTW